MTEAKKITAVSVREMGCKPETAKTAEAPVNLCTIYGKVTGVKAKEDKSGNVAARFVGRFEGVNLETNESYTAGVLRLPAGIHEYIAKAFDAAKGVTILFALLIRAVKAGNAIGYAYQAEPIVQPAPADDLGGLRKVVSEKMAAPATAPESKPEAAHAAGKRK